MSIKHLSVISFLSAFLCIAATASAQTYTIKGTVKSSSGGLLQGAALLINTQANTLIRTDIVDKGQVLFTDVQEENVSLQISVTGYTDTTILIANAGNAPVKDIGIITLQQLQQLGEVAVSAKAPMFVQTDEGRRINVENTMLATSANATELLSKTPGVSVTGNKVNIFGKGEALIYLGGRQITFERLNCIPVDRIKSIDVITNPSAKYDARGRAVVNVTLKKNTSEGLSGSVMQNVTQAMYTLANTVLNVNYGKNKLSLSGDVSVNPGKDWNENNYGMIYKLPSGTWQTKSYYTESSSLTSVWNYRLGLGYELSKNTDISLQYDGLYNLFNLATHNTSDTYAPSGAGTNIQIFNNGKTINVNNSGNLNLNHKLDTLGSNLFIGTQYNSFENTLYDQINERIVRSDSIMNYGQRINDGHNRINLFIAQADLNKIFRNSSRLDAGIKYYTITNDSRIIFRTRNGAETIFRENPVFANSFIYRETVPAAYAMYSGSIKKLGYTLGTRGELSQVSGYSRKMDRSIFDTTYFNLFPSAKATYTLNNKWNTTLNYSYRINRPVYQDIDPFVWYIDSLTSIQGNSSLRPAYTNSFEWLWAYTSFTLKLGYAHTRGAIRSIAKTGSTGVNSVIFIKENMQHFIQYTASAEIPVETKRFNSYNTIACNLNEIKDTRPGFITRPLTPQLYLYTYNQFLFPKVCNVDISGEYYSRVSDGMTLRKEPYYYISAGLSRSFFNKKLSCQLMWNDILWTAKNVGEKTVGVITNYYAQRFNTTYVRCTINYKFGGSSKFRNKAVNTAEYNRIKK